MHRIADILRITKCVHNHVGSHLSQMLECGVWPPSSLWLLIRIAIQMSRDRSPFGWASYKRFMLFFICTVPRDANGTDLHSDLLHLMSCNTLRRLKKLGSSTPDWLFEMALTTYGCLRETLDTRFKQPSMRPFPSRNPSQDELPRDAQYKYLICSIIM